MVRLGMADERLYMEWDDLGVAARSVAEQIAADGYEPDIILGIPRGGLLVAGALSYALGSRTRTR